MLFPTFYPYGAASKLQRGDPFVTDSKKTRSQSLRDEIFVAKEQHNECELRRSATKPCNFIVIKV